MSQKKKPLEQQIVNADLLEEQMDKEQQAKALEAYQQSGYTPDRDFAVGLFNRAQIHNGYARLATAASLIELSKVKESKAYRHLSGLTYIDSNGEIGNVLPTWEGFLLALGLSRRTVDDQLLNLKTVGQEAFDAMTRAGIGTRDFRMLRKIPHEDRNIIVNEIEANLDDKDSIIGLIDTLSTKHTKEKENLEKEILDLKQKDESNERFIAAKDKKINDLDRQLDRLKNKVDDWHPRTFEISMETTKAGCEALEGIDKLNSLRDVILNEDFGEEDRDKAIEAMAVVYYDAVAQVMEQAAWLMQHCNQVFEGYKLGAKPLVEMADLYGEQENQGQ